MPLFFSPLSSCRAPALLHAQVAPDPATKKKKWNNVAFDRFKKNKTIIITQKKACNWKPPLLSLSGCAADAGWPPPAQTHSIVLSPEEARPSSQLQITAKKEEKKKCSHTTLHRHTKGQVVAVASCHQRVQTMCPHRPRFGFSPRFLQAAEQEQASGCRIGKKEKT